MWKRVKTTVYWAGFAGIMLSLGSMSSCPGRPICNGSCGAPADTDDCAMCCNGGEEDCQQCCQDAYEGDPKWNTCSANCDRRWHISYTPEPGGPYDGDIGPQRWVAP